MGKWLSKYGSTLYTLCMHSVALNPGFPFWIFVSQQQFFSKAAMQVLEKIQSGKPVFKGCIVGRLVTMCVHIQFCLSVWVCHLCIIWWIFFTECMFYFGIPKMLHYRYVYRKVRSGAHIEVKSRGKSSKIKASHRYDILKIKSQEQLLLVFLLTKTNHIVQKCTMFVANHRKWEPVNTGLIWTTGLTLIWIKWSYLTSRALNRYQRKWSTYFYTLPMITNQLHCC